MEGIEILAETSVNYLPVRYCWIIVIGIIAFFGFFSSCVFTKKIGMIINGIIFISMIIIGGIVQSKYTYTEYEVTMPKSVDFYEFIDKYEILDQKGKIIIVRDKDYDNKKGEN